MPLKKPTWLKKPLPDPTAIFKVEDILSELRLHTVCQSARCPNKGECFKEGTATFMLMGNICTRNCHFCAVKSGKPLALNEDEPSVVARAVKKLGLRHVVITSVTRDDLPDGGAGHFAETIIQVRKVLPETTIELLVPDFKENDSSIKTVCSARPDVFNHNIETVPRLYPQVRPDASYQGSLKVLARACELHIPTKSAVMVGLGESPDELAELMQDLVRVGCKILTIGQYLQPTRDNLPVTRYYSPDEFAHLGKMGLRAGLLQVASSPFARSSYQAAKIFSILSKSKSRIH